MVLRLALKSILSRRSSAVIVIFMSFAATLLVVSNAVFDSTEQGVQNSFTASFTGDFIIRPISNVPLSLFGDETPVTGELSEVGRVIPFEPVVQALDESPRVSAYIPHVSGLAVMEHGGARRTVSLFGVQGDRYLEMMPGIHLVEGRGYTGGEKGMLLPVQLAQEIGAGVGSIVQFTIADGISFRIRAVPVTGIFAYKTSNAIFDRFVLVSPGAVRELMDIADAYSLDASHIDSSKMDMLDFQMELEDLFSATADVDAVFEDASSDEGLPDSGEVPVATPANTAWNFIICRTGDGVDPRKAMHEMNKEFRRNQWPVEAVNWRHAAGSTALYLYWMRIIFNGGILVVMAAGFIVVNNTLVVNVLDRTREIGTMRALGASRLFVSAQCMVETLLMALASAVVGCIAGGLASMFITSLGISFSNEFLVQLFGDAALVVSVSWTNALKIIILMLCLGVLGWIYPVMVALRVHPIEAIQGVK